VTAKVSCTLVKLAPLTMKFRGIHEDETDAEYRIEQNLIRLYKRYNYVNK